MTSQTGNGPAVAPNLDICTSTQQMELGTVVQGPAGKSYRYVKFLDAVAYVAGHVVTRASATDWHVTNDRAGGSAIAGHEVVGVVFQSAANVPTVGQFGWVQCGGLAAVAGTYAAGNQLIPHATVDGTAVISAYSAADVSFNIFGNALSASLVRLKGLN